MGGKSKSQMELVRRSNRLNVQIALENRLVRHAWRASKLEEAHLAKQVDIERRKRRQEVAQLRRRRETLQSEVRHHRSGVPNKPFHENNNHLKHLTIAVKRGAEKFAKQRIMMARRLAAGARRVAQKSVGSMERERRWWRQLTAVAQWESRQVHSLHNREWHLRSGEKKYQHIIRELRAKIQAQKGSHARKSKTLLKKEVMRVEGKILRELRQFRAKEASRRKELKNFKLRMQEISQRLLKAHVKAKFVLSSLKAEKMKGGARLLQAINSAREKGISAHTRARWASKLNKYKNERAQLYRKIIEQNADLAKKLRVGRKSFAKAQRVLAEEVREVEREKVVKHVRVRSKQYFVHLKEEKAEMLKVERRNKAFIRKLAEQKSKTLEKLQREREEHAIEGGRLHKESIAFAKEFENNERDIVMLKRMKKRLLKMVMGERLKSEKYVTHARSVQVTFRNHVIHRRGLSEALKIIKARLWKMEKESKKERLKTKIAGERAAILEKRKVESISWSRRVQKIHNVLLAELRRRELERARLMVRRRILHDDFVKTHLARRAISRKIRRIRSLEHILEKMKGRGLTYYEAARRMRKKAVVEISRIKLAKLNVVRKLRRVQKRMQDKLRELHSGKYKTMKSLRKLEEWRGVKSHKWAMILREAEIEFKHQVRKEKKFVALLRSAKMRAVYVMGHVARRKVSVIKTGQNLSIERGLFVRAKKELKGLRKVQANFLRKLHKINKERFRLVGILRQKQLTISRKLHHAVEKRVLQLKKASEWKRTHAGTLAREYARLKQQRERARNGYINMKLQGGRNFRKMISGEGHAFRKAVAQQSHFVLELRDVWSKLHSALQLTRRMSVNSRLEKSRQRKITLELEQQKKRLIKLLAREEQSNKVAFHRQKLWSSQALMKWRNRVTKKVRVNHRVITNLESEIKRARVEKRGIIRGGGRIRLWLARIKHQLKGLTRDEAFLMEEVKSAAREGKKETQVAMILRKRSIQLHRVEMAVRKIVEEGRRKLAKGLRSEHERAVGGLKRNLHWLSLEKEKWEFVWRDIKLMRHKLKRKLQHQHAVLRNVLNKLRAEQLRKSEIMKGLTKLGFELTAAHERLLEVRKLGEMQGRVQHGKEIGKELFSVFTKDTEWKKRLIERIKKVRKKVKEAIKKVFVLSHAQGQL